MFERQLFDVVWFQTYSVHMWKKGFDTVIAKKYVAQFFWSHSVYSFPNFYTETNDLWHTTTSPCALCTLSNAYHTATTQNRRTS